VVGRNPDRRRDLGKRQVLGESVAKEFAYTVEPTWGMREGSLDP
jgi:hypothetical protein